VSSEPAVDIATGSVGWESAGRAVRAIVPGALAARAGAEWARVTVLTAGALVLLDEAGRECRRIAAPDGISLSHFGEDGDVVGQSEAPSEGWWDWRFEADLDAGALRRVGPAY
jgi:hypothetical protein